MTVHMRPTARTRGYNWRWEKARKTYLATHPLCVMFNREGHARAATLVDHIIPHKGDTALFWDVRGNWQALCKPHHDKDKQREERGSTQAVDETGWPI